RWNFARLHFDKHIFFVAAVVTNKRGVHRQHTRRTGEVRDHIELRDYRRRTTLELDAGRIGQGANEVDPLAHAARIDTRDTRKIETDVCFSPELDSERFKVDVLIDRAVEVDRCPTIHVLDLPFQSITHAALS